MMIERTVDIEAPAAIVWQVMADVEQWSTWTASITSIVVDPGRGPESGGLGPGEPGPGELGPGRRAVVRQPGFPKARWTVTDWQPGRAFTWESPAPGVLSVGVHAVEPTGERCCRATLAISQTGKLSGLLGLLAGRRSVRYVGMERDGLKARAEELARVADGMSG